jgi:hypothetical protein
MRTIAIFANFGLLGITCYELLAHGLPVRADEWWLFSFLIVAPVFSLIALFSSKDGKGWLALFLKRKALEEQKKIDGLAKHDDT